MNERKGKKISVTCMRCNAIFIAYRKSRKYCSKCRAKVNAEMAIESYTKYRKGKPLKDRIIKCGICGNPINAKGISNLKYCSDNCRKEALRIYKKDYKKKHPDKLKERNKNYYQKNRDKHLEYSKEYYQKNKDIARISKIKHHSKKYFDGNWEKVLERDNRTCQICGSKKKLLVHHRDGTNIFSGVPNNSLDNLITICRACHNKIHNTKN
jgi:5-methylcytosine-specific restriction endonuclease McrA